MAVIHGTSRNLTNAEFCRLHDGAEDPILAEAVERLDSLLDDINIREAATKEEIDGVIHTLEQIKSDL